MFLAVLFGLLGVKSNNELYALRTGLRILANLQADGSVSRIFEMGVDR